MRFNGSFLILGKILFEVVLLSDVLFPGHHPEVQRNFLRWGAAIAAEHITFLTSYSNSDSLSFAF